MLPLLRSKNTTKEYAITSFGGINNSFSQKLNEFCDGYNMTSENFPALSSARGSSVFGEAEYTLCGGAFYNKLYTLEYSNSEKTEISILEDGEKLSAFETDKTVKRKTAFIKDEFLIIPDNVIYNIVDKKVSMGSVTEISSSKSALAKYKTEHPTATALPSSGQSWYCAKLYHNSLVAKKDTYSYSGSSYTFYNFCISEKFKEGDIVTIKMDVEPYGESTVSDRQTYIKKMEKGIQLKIKGFTKAVHETAMKNTITEYVSIIFEDNSIDLSIFDEVLATKITIEKTIPDFNDICSFENRMWGVTDSEICASLLGNCSVWEDFTADQYGTLPSSCFKSEVESDGTFTAITAYNGNVMAFKEDCIYKIYGNEPAEFKLSYINCPGVKKGQRDTVAIAGGILFYMSKSGIYSYNGSTFELVSRGINIADYETLTAVGDERYYRISVTNGNENYLFVYDTRYGIWNKIAKQNAINFLIKTDDGITEFTDTAKATASTGNYGDWGFTLNFGKKEFSSRHICSVFVRYTLKENGNIKIQIRNKHGTYTIADTSSPADNYPLRLFIPVSCARDADLIFSGTGNFTLISLTVRYKETGIND